MAEHELENGRETEAPSRPKRGTVLRDRLGRRWRVSNRGNAYEINAGGHRQGSHRYANLRHLEAGFGPLTQEPTDTP